MIKVERLTKIFHNGAAELKALKGVSFTVNEGEFLAVNGRSGSGKSTLLYQLGLLDTPTSGNIILNGHNTSTMNDRERTDFRLNELGYVFQDYALIPTLTAKENVMVPLLMQGVSTTEAEKMAEIALKRVGLGEKMRNLPSQLSGGQQQRVSIARAIGHNPKIIFADEPTANLDSETSLLVLESFISLHKEGQTIIMVTHEDEYAAMADRIITLHDGEITKEVINKNPRRVQK